MTVLLKSHQMDFSARERRWLPWLGATGKIAMRWSCWLNRRIYPTVEKAFEGIANTRRNQLVHWAEGNWEFLSTLAEQLGGEHGGSSALLSEWLKRASDFSELFVIDPGGKVVASTYAKHVGASDLNPKAVAAGLKGPFLHGPYSDAVTLAIGPSSSKFHDAVTLMFYRPMKKDGQTIGCLCGRVPNDVMGDIIQREAGHVYRDSGDNYIFMAESRFDPSIKPGTALSRSRFEDNTFTAGDNLRDGVNTKFGKVRIQKHTELELSFIDPATGQLHPGVRETINKGDNLFVTYPGYPDYRRIPVVGKGITFAMPGSADRWGMMCEADLEEAYRRRPVPYFIMKRGLGITTLVVAADAALWAYMQPSPQMGGLMTLALGTLAAWMFNVTTLQPMSRRLDAMSDFLLNIAECRGSLDQRLAVAALANDESGDLGRWINSFVDKIDDTVSSVLHVAEQVTSSSSELARISARVAESSSMQNQAAASTSSAVDVMSGSITEVASRATATENISNNANTLSLDGKNIVADAVREMEKTATSISELSELIETLDKRSVEISGILNVIREIADQTNLLALNAAIEAARAGEQGRGFAVVADEVRKLAERTAASTTEITGMIHMIQEETRHAVGTMQDCRQQAESGVELANQAGQSLEQINEGADNTLQMVREIAQATREQIETGNRIAQNVERIAQMAEENNTQVLDAARSAHTLEQLASDLQKAVSKFSV